MKTDKKIRDTKGITDFLCLDEAFLFLWAGQANNRNRGEVLPLNSDNREEVNRCEQKKTICDPCRRTLSGLCLIYGSGVRN